MFFGASGATMHPFKIKYFINMPAALFRFFSNLFSSGDQGAPVRDAETPVDLLQTEIRSLVAHGKTEEALHRLREAGFGEATLLSAQIIKGKADFEQGKIKFDQWTQIQNRVNYAVLHFFNKDGHEERSEPKQPTPPAEVPVTEAQKNEIRQLIFEDKTAEALALCSGWGADFMLTQKRFLETRKHWNRGLIDFETLRSANKQIDEALLFYVDQHPLIPE